MVIITCEQLLSHLYKQENIVWKSFDAKTPVHNSLICILNVRHRALGHTYITRTLFLAHMYLLDTYASALISRPNCAGAKTVSLRIAIIFHRVSVASYNYSQITWIRFYRCQKSRLSNTASNIIHIKSVHTALEWQRQCEFHSRWYEFRYRWYLFCFAFSFVLNLTDCKALVRSRNY